MRQRRFYAGVAMAATTALLIGGCGSSSGDVPATEGEVGGELRIGMPTSWQPATQLMADAFMKEHPNVTIDVTAANTDPYQQTTRTQLASKTAPDVVYVWPGSATVMSVQTIAPEGVLVDLSDEEWTSIIPESQKTLTQDDGKTYVLPMVYGAIGAIYNTDAFEKAGIEVPRTWTELLDSCDALNAVNIAPFALGLQSPANGQFINYSLVATEVYAEDPDFNEQLLNDEATFEDSGWRTAMEKYMEMNERGCFQPNPTGTPADEALRMVSTGEAAMSVQTVASIVQVRSAAPDTEFGLFALPASDDAEANRMPVALAGTFGVTSGSKNQATAKEFLRFMAENQALYAEQITTLPTDPEQIPETDDPALLEISSFVDAERTGPYPDQTWPSPKVQQAHLQVVQELFTGSTDVDGALEKMQEAFGSK